MKGKLQEETITLINVYAPPESTKKFFKSLFSLMALESEGIVICAGDFNIIMDHRVDITSIKRNKIHIRSKFVNMLLKEHRLVDVWRELHPREKDYTHYSPLYKHTLEFIIFL